MNGKAPSINSPWYTEPLKRISTYVATAVAAIGGAIALANELTGLGFVPPNIRTDVTVAVGIATGVVAFLHKLQGYLGRNGVPGTTFNGMLSPQHTHEAMVQSAIPQPLVQAGVITPHLSTLGDALGVNPDGTPKG